MTSLTRADREARIERDQANPEDTVHLVKTAPRVRSLIYHDDPDCGSFKSGVELAELSRREAQRRGRAPCIHCVLEEDVPRPGTGSDIHNQLADPDFGPEKVGLSPIGQRRDRA